jgi:hypothetical protein
LNHLDSLSKCFPFPPNQLEPVSSRHPHSVGYIHDGRISGSSSVLGNHRCSSTVRHIFPIGRASTLIVMMDLRTDPKMRLRSYGVASVGPVKFSFCFTTFRSCVCWIRSSCFHFGGGTLSVSPVNANPDTIHVSSRVLVVHGSVQRWLPSVLESSRRGMPWQGESISSVTFKVFAPSPSLAPPHSRHSSSFMRCDWRQHDCFSRRFRLCGYVGRSELFE